MAVTRGRASRAAALHRRAVATVEAAGTVLDEIRPAPADQRRQYDLADQLRTAARVLAPGWAGAPWEELSEDVPPFEIPPGYVVVGAAAPLDEARFPALVPLLGAGHLTVDGDGGDPRVAGLLQAVLLRLLAACPAGSLLVRAVEGTAGGEVFAPFAALADAGLLPPPVCDVTGLRGVLTEAEQWAAPENGRHGRRDRTLLVVVSGLPTGTGPAELARLVELAGSGPAANLHLVVAGWPAEQEALRTATAVTLRNEYALVGNPPGAPFGAVGGGTPGGLNAPVFLTGAPPPELTERVCRRLSEQVEAGFRLTLSDLLPEAGAPLWGAGSAAGLSTTVGMAGGRPVPLGFTELTPHWLVSGRSTTLRSTFVTDVLLGLAARYGPEELGLHLVDLGPGESFAEFLQTERDRTWVPQVRTAAMAADREYVLDLFEQLAAEVRRRREAGVRTGGQRFPELREHLALPRIVCVIHNVHLLLDPTGSGVPAPRTGSVDSGGPAERGGRTVPPRVRDRIGAAALAGLDALARTGRAYGVHLLLVGEGDLGLGSGTGSRDSMLGQFPVRVALPGGGAVLEPSNDSATGLPVGSAVVNTAGGLGGPQGATRGHERVIRFPDPEDAAGAVTELRHRLCAARPEGVVPPVVFAGYARPLLRNDPRHRTALLGRAPGRAALLGRAVDVARSTVAVPLDGAPGRNLAVLGPGPAAARLLVTAVRSTVAHHPPGTARVVVACLVEEAAPLAAALVEDLSGQHVVRRVDLTGLRELLPDAPPTGATAAGASPGEGATLLVVFGLDVPDEAELPREGLRRMLREGPPGGTTLLGWWRTTPALAGLLEPEQPVGELAAVVAVEMPGAQLAGVLGRPVEWRPRPGRAVLWDTPEEQGRVLVPFAAEDEEELS